MKKVDPTFENITELTDELISKLNKYGVEEEIRNDLFEDMKNFSEKLKKDNAEKISDFIGHEIDGEQIKVFLK